MKKIISALLILLLTFAISIPTEASTSKLYNGKARWKRLKGAKYYNVYYKESDGEKFIHAAGHLSKDTDDFSIKHLIIGETYVYRISAVDKYGNEVWVTPIQTLPKIY